MALMLLLTALVALFAASTLQSNLIFSYYYGSPSGLKPWEQPGNQITHVLFSFANLLDDGTVTYQGPQYTDSGRNGFNKAAVQVLGNADVADCGCSQCVKGELYQTYLLKRKYPHLKIILSIGGWAWSDNFSVVMASQPLRKRAIDTAGQLLADFGFDGLDIDWEFPGTQKDTSYYKFWRSSPNDWDNLAVFFTEARDAYKDKYILTAATPAYIFNGSKETWTKLGQLLDYVLVMAYEFQHDQARTWGGGTLRSTADDSESEKANNLVNGMTSYSMIPPSKIVLGIPLYGTGYKGLTSGLAFRDSIPGFGAPTAGLTPLEPTAYNELLDSFPQNKYSMQVDSQRGVAVWYNGTHVWFIDSPQTVALKAKYALDQKYAGLMLWNSAQDKLGDLSLIASIHAVMPANTSVRANLQQPWCLQESGWCNLKCSYNGPLLTDTTTGPSSGSTSASSPLLNRNWLLILGSMLLVALLA